MPRRAPSNACWALARRQVTGRRVFGPDLPRQTLSLRQVLREEAGGVLLGFSSDGNFLVYCISLDSSYEVQWIKINFQDFYNWSEDGHAPKVGFKLRVDGGISDYEVSTPLEVWQTVDEGLVLAITIDTLSEDRETSRLSRVVVAPSPVFDDGGRAVAVSSLSFEFSQQAHSQKLEKWQLLQLVNEPKNVYHVLVNAGTALYVLVFHVWKRSHKTEMVTPTADTRPRGLGISYFPENAWYYPPVFPVKFQNSTVHRQQDAGLGESFTAGVECICQHLFDVEGFLGEFLETFKPLQHYNLVDYDLRLIRVMDVSAADVHIVFLTPSNVVNFLNAQASVLEKTVFMIYVMSLAPSSTEPTRPGNHYLRVALYLSLEIFTGTHHIIRALKVPGNGDLRHISQIVARKFHADLNGRLPHEPTTTAWDNEALLREESLHELHNPQYPISISST